MVKKQNKLEQDMLYKSRNFLQAVINQLHAFVQLKPNEFVWIDLYKTLNNGMITRDHLFELLYNSRNLNDLWECLVLGRELSPDKQLTKKFIKYSRWIRPYCLSQSNVFSLRQEDEQQEQQEQQTQQCNRHRFITRGCTGKCQDCQWEGCTCLTQHCCC